MYSVEIRYSKSILCYHEVVLFPCFGSAVLNAGKVAAFHYGFYVNRHRILNKDVPWLCLILQIVTAAPVAEAKPTFALIARLIQLRRTTTTTTTTVAPAAAAPATG